MSVCENLSVSENLCLYVSLFFYRQSHSQSPRSQPNLYTSPNSSPYPAASAGSGHSSSPLVSHNHQPNAGKISCLYIVWFLCFHLSGTFVIDIIYFVCLGVGHSGKFESMFLLLETVLWYNHGWLRRDVCLMSSVSHDIRISWHQIWHHVCSNRTVKTLANR